VCNYPRVEVNSKVTGYGFDTKYLGIQIFVFRSATGNRFPRVEFSSLLSDGLYVVF
jgi:hypothetical protein